MHPLYQQPDLLLRKTRALPAEAGNVTSGAIQLHPVGEPCLIDGELVIKAPALTNAQLPNTKTAVYAILHGDSAESLTWLATVGTQAGAGAGAAAVEFRFKPHHQVGAFVALKITTDGAVDASGASATLDFCTQL